MFDIDPPGPILRLASLRKGDGGTVFTDSPISFPNQLDRYLAKREADAAVLRVKVLAEADGCFAKRIAAL